VQKRYNPVVFNNACNLRRVKPYVYPLKSSSEKEQHGGKNLPSCFLLKKD